jgi:hypothetical protein
MDTLYRKKVEDGKVLIPKLWIPMDRKISTKDISNALQYFDEQETDLSIENMSELMKREKVSICSYAKSNIEQQMYTNAKFYKVKYGTVEKRTVKNLDDLKQVYKEIETEQEEALFWYIVVGYFSEVKSWFENLSKKYMDLRNWKYSDRDIDKKVKGFVERLMRKVYRETVRRLRYSNKDNVVGGLRKSRPKELITEKTKYLRKKQGEFESYMGGVQIKKKKVKNQLLTRSHIIYINYITNCMS